PPPRRRPRSRAALLLRPWHGWSPGVGAFRRPPVMAEGAGEPPQLVKVGRAKRIGGNPRTRWRPDGSIGKPAARGRSSPPPPGRRQRGPGGRGEGAAGSGDGGPTAPGSPRLACDTGNMQGYGQYCPLARGAEVLGDRWTLLIIREMLFGVQRFNELERFLPGISRSVLAQRLRHLQRVG